jgi:hypothetical protein
MIDHTQCKDCIYAAWAFGKAGRGHGYKPKFIWCNHLDHTGEPHIVKDGVCLSHSKTKAAKLTEQLAKETLERTVRK